MKPTGKKLDVSPGDGANPAKKIIFWGTFEQLDLPIEE